MYSFNQQTVLFLTIVPFFEPPHPKESIESMCRVLPY